VKDVGASIEAYQKELWGDEEFIKAEDKDCRESLCLNKDEY
jgi:hypothetical protein